MNYYLEILVKLLLSLICGGLVGIEREKKKKHAGLRTYMTICISTTIAMMIAKQCYLDTNSGDISRIASGCLQGLGFLGAGVILHNKTSKHIEGLTTSVLLWATAVLGLAIGYGLYFLSICATLIFLFIAHVVPIFVYGLNKKK